MNLLANLVCFLLGALFIFSGFVKAVDPEGFAYKLTEYFLLDEFNFFGTEFLISTSLVQSVLICAFEIGLGFAFLISHNIKRYAWWALLMIIFFTFLTGYSYGFDVVKECGCFGNAIPLTAGQSFVKDIILLLILIPIFIFRKHINQIVLTERQGMFFTYIGTFLSAIISIWGLMHLPIVDFRSYKEGNNIIEKMSDGVPAKVEYYYTFEKDGQTQNSTDYAGMIAKGWTYKAAGSNTLVEEVKPSIEDFTIEDKDGNDLKTEFFDQNKYMILILFKHIEDVDADILKSIEQFRQNSPVDMIGLTASLDQDLSGALSKSGLQLDFYNCDEKAIATFVRANPGIVLMKGDLIVKKWHHNDMPDLEELNELMQ